MVILSWEPLMGLEIERKFLVENIPKDIIKTRILNQGYLVRKKDRVVRVRTVTRQKRLPEAGKGFLTIKGETREHTRPEYEYEIPFEEARQMLNQFCSQTLIEKLRIWTRYRGKEWIIDQFSGKNRGLILAEIELASPDEPFDIPPWAGPEVSHDPRYFNSNLVGCPYCLWPK